MKQFELTPIIETRWALRVQEMEAEFKRSGSLKDKSVQGRKGQYVRHRLSHLERKAAGMFLPKSSGVGSSQASGHGISERPMAQRFSAVGKGAQPAVVKLVSYGSGARMGSMFAYVSRDGELPMENEKGEKLQGKEVFAELRSDWQHTVSNRQESIDVASFRVGITRTGPDIIEEDTVRSTLSSGFGARKYAYVASLEENGDVVIEGVVALRSEQGERLSGDRKASEIVQDRFNRSDAGKEGVAAFSFTGRGHGIDYGASRAKSLFADTPVVSTQDGEDITRERFNTSLSVEWKPILHARKVRDVMHVMVSAREGTNSAQFEHASRAFFADAFAGHKYIFSLHDPSTDPKEAGDGGKRPHVHAHAIVTMRSVTGDRIVPTISTFRDWRTTMSHHAREAGIEMEMTDRREFANAPSFQAKHVKRSYDRKSAATINQPINDNARRRLHLKHVNSITAVRSPASAQYMSEAKATWAQVQQVGGTGRLIAFAGEQVQRLEMAQLQTKSVQTLGENVPRARLLEGKKTPELNPSELPAFHEKARKVYDAIEATDKPLTQRAEAAAEFAKFVESTERLAYQRDAVRKTLSPEDSEKYDDLTRQRNQLGRELSKEDGREEREEQVSKITDSLEKMESAYYAAQKQREVDNERSKSGSDTSTGDVQRSAPEERQDIDRSASDGDQNQNDTPEPDTRDTRQDGRIEDQQNTLRLQRIEAERRRQASNDESDFEI